MFGDAKRFCGAKGTFLEAASIPISLLECPLGVSGRLAGALFLVGGRVIAPSSPCFARLTSDFFDIGRELQEARDDEELETGRRTRGPGGCSENDGDRDQGRTSADAIDQWTGSRRAKHTPKQKCAESDAKIDLIEREMPLNKRARTRDDGDIKPKHQAAKRA